MSSPFTQHTDTITASQADREVEERVVRAKRQRRWRIWLVARAISILVAVTLVAVIAIVLWTFVPWIE